MGKPLSFDDNKDLNKKIFQSIKSFNKIGDLPQTKKELIIKRVKFEEQEIIIDKIDYYYSNVVARASKTMSECRQVLNKALSTGTGG